MFHVPSDVVLDHRFNVLTDNDHTTLNLIQIEHLDAIPLSPENTPSSSPASLSCSSLNTWQSTSDQLQTPIFSLPGPICRNFGAIAASSSDEPSDQRIACVQISAFDAASSQEPAIPAIDEGGLEDLRWTTGVPYHMIDVFRANPFTAMDIPLITSTTPLDNSMNPDTAECKVAGSHRARSAAKHVLSPDAVEQKRKTRTKRARIQSPSLVPFPATGPQQMYAYEFRLDPPYEGTGFPRAEEYRKYGDLPPSYSLSRGTDGHDNLHVPRPVLAYNPEDAFLRLPVVRDWSERCMQHSRLFPTSMPLPLPTQRSTYLEDPSNPAISAPSQGLDDSTTRFEAYGCSPLPPVVPIPIRVIPERAQTFRPSLAPVGLSIQKSLYACPLCPRDFQLPNGLALHLKWHDRVGNLATNSSSHPNYRPQTRTTESAPLNARDVRLNQQGTILPSYASQRAAQTESVSTLWCWISLYQTDTLPKVALSHGQFTSSALSYERQHQECALFRDVLQSNHSTGFSLSLDNNAYLAPLDGLSVLQPLPFEQCYSASGQLCSLPPS
jgi:hypothetical protein